MSLHPRPYTHCRQAFAAFLALAFLPLASRGQEPPQPTFEDPAFKPLREAAVTWGLRQGPRRRVRDIVCLVPDVPTFLEALGEWDDSTYFPILIDDAETNLKFLRAFHPTTVVRYPRAAAPLPPGTSFDAAVQAVGRAWVKVERETKGDIPDASKPPEGFGPTPPGVVFSDPSASALAGAAALAAGRFEPLIHCEPGQPPGVTLSDENAAKLAFGLEVFLTQHVPAHKDLGDDCDFITIAGDWPDRYDSQSGPRKGVAALDDVLGRTRGSGLRWAFIGRLTGDPATSVYRAMCSLFLQPDAALLFNSYDESGAPWKDFDMRPAAVVLDKAVPTNLIRRGGGLEPTVAGWHRVFDPLNRFGLVLINTSGNPTDFNLPGGAGQTADVPMTDPAAVLMVHSFSAANPGDPSTIAGRWLANGAYLYFGSLNEPFLQAFRSPSLVADLLARHMPVAAAVRQSFPGELFATPWRLHLLGDPLYRILPPHERAERQGGAPDAWPVYERFARPDPAASDSIRLSWVVKRAVVDAARFGRKPPDAALVETILSIDRASLPESVQPVYDATLADTLARAGRFDLLRSKLGAIPDASASDDIRRWLETARVADLQRDLTLGQFANATGVWDEIVRSSAPEGLKRQVTNRLGAAANRSQADLIAWRRRLEATLPNLQSTNGAPTITEELDRVRERLGQGRAKP